MSPKIEGAPGLLWRSNKTGWEVRWKCRSDIAAKGFRPRAVRLWNASLAGYPEPNALDIPWIVDRANALQNEMLAFSHGLFSDRAYNGEMDGLVNSYQTHRKSPYVKGEAKGGLRYTSRKQYDSLCDMLIRDFKGKKLADLDAEQIDDWYETYADAGKVGMGYGLVKMLRTLVSFGALYIKSPDLKALKDILSEMRFANTKPREAILTYEQIKAIIAIAPPSIKIGQMLQFVCGMRQKDIIGEWVPVSEPGMSAVTYGNEKWLRGLDWREVDQNFMLTHVTSKRQKKVVVDLKIDPMVAEVLGPLERSRFPASGPIVVCERTGLPWSPQGYRSAWRELATQVGVPADVRNMDTRAGAITEALNAGAEMDQVRKMATHSDSKMTARYSRGEAEAVSNVNRIRVAARNKNGPATT